MVLVNFLFVKPLSPLLGDAGLLHAPGHPLLLLFQALLFTLSLSPPQSAGFRFTLFPHTITLPYGGKTSLRALPTINHLVRGKVTVLDELLFGFG